MATNEHGSSDVVPVTPPSGAVVGTGVVPADAFENPGLPPHRPRVTDLDPKKKKRAARFIVAMFWLSVLGSVSAIFAYMFYPIEDGSISSVRLNTLFVGLSIALSLLAIGIAAVHWGKAVMADKEGVDERHPVRGTAATRSRAVEIFKEADEESGFSRRTLIRGGLIASLVAFPLPAIALFRGLAPMDVDPNTELKHTMWKKGLRLTQDPTGTPIKAADVTIGSAFQVIPEGLVDLPEHEKLDAKAKAAVLLVRLKPEDLHWTSKERESWSYDGIVAYSKICTHVGCPVALYEQQTHHLLCPCHQSQFDIANECKVIFGPAARPLPQLPITVDSEGYLVATSDFTEPVGPSFWERSTT
ncbi:MAG: Rieske 2Fe-2S domain-containing protein [Microbacteriaceae bacterium]